MVPKQSNQPCELNEFEVQHAQSKFFTMSTEFDIKTFQNEAKIALIAKCALIFFFIRLFKWRNICTLFLTCGDANKALTVQIMQKSYACLTQGLRGRSQTTFDKTLFITDLPQVDICEGLAKDLNATTLIPSNIVPASKICTYLIKQD